MLQLNRMVFTMHSSDKFDSDNNAQTVLIQFEIQFKMLRHMLIGQFQ